MSPSSSTLHSLHVPRQPHVLTIAGSDSGGGAGIQADLKTAAALGCYGSSALTALTAQNTLGVQGVHIVPPEFVVQQLASLLADDMAPDAVKFGMLAGEDTIRALAAFVREQWPAPRPFLVLDPVMVATSGATLLPTAATRTLVDELLPLVHLVTPNLPEACVIVAAGSGASGTANGNAGCPLPTPRPAPTTLEGMLALAEEVRTVTKVPAVLLKGGHLTLSRTAVAAAAAAAAVPVQWDESGDTEDIDIEFILDWRKANGLPMPSDDVIVDVLIDAQGTRLFVAEKVETSSTHGTGCTLSAALASCYALEAGAGAGAKGAKGAKDAFISHAAVQRAIEYTQSSIAAAFPMGRGHGPLNHGHLTQPRALPPPSAHNPTPFVSYLVRSCKPVWREYVRHPFVDQLGKGTLPLGAFKHYIIQDYHYLRHYARAHALGAMKATDFETISEFTAIAQHIAQESTMHVGFCEQFGVSKAELFAAPESAACSAYARYIIDIGQQGDLLELYVAVAACLVGYGEVGLWLARRAAAGTGAAVLEGNPYRRWMEDYAGPEFIGAVRRGIANLERRIAADPPTPARLARLAEIWAEVVRLERNFWQMGLDLSF